MDHLLDKVRKIKCLICDVDGVLTDGRNYIDNHGNELKAFHVHDGVGLKLLMAAGIEIAVITGSVNAVIDHRMAQLGIQHYFKNHINKSLAYTELKARLQLQDDAFAYIGDDVVDLPIMHQVGFSIAVANAVSTVKNRADWTTTAVGGHGGLREACDFILATQKKTDMAIHGYIYGNKDKEDA
jgi:3-deoxy-D-manno-octulosonate 8-phosphate phosphatase (KDO 8-P phosphatase)